MSGLISLLLGVLFGIGLLLSGMTNPAKVQGFLDIAGNWDPSLALVMAGAIAAAFLPFQWAKRQQHCALGAPMQLPVKRQIDRPLVLGSALFGIGWGLSGICPGPAIVNAGAQVGQVFWFLVPMIFSMAAYQWWQTKSQQC